MYLFTLQNSNFHIHSQGQTNIQIGEKNNIKIENQETCVNANNVTGLERRMAVLERQYSSINVGLNELTSAVRNYQSMYVSRIENENETESGTSNEYHDQTGYEEFTNTDTNDVYDDESQSHTQASQNIDDTQVKQPIVDSIYDDITSEMMLGGAAGAQYDVYDDESQSHTQASQNIDDTQVKQPIVDSIYDDITAEMMLGGAAGAQYDYRRPLSNWHATILTLLTEIRDRLSNIPIHQPSSSNNHHQIPMSVNADPHYNSISDATIPPELLDGDRHRPLEEREYYNIGDMTITETQLDILAAYEPISTSQTVDYITAISSSYRSISSLTEMQRMNVHRSPGDATLTNEFQVFGADRSSGRRSTTNGMTRNRDFEILIKHRNGLRSERRHQWISVGPTTTIHDIKKRFMDCFGCRPKVDYIVTQKQNIRETHFDDLSTLGCLGVDGGSVVHCVSYQENENCIYDLDDEQESNGIQYSALVQFDDVMYISRAKV
ncbi:uncharacterized protein LOC126810248 [Patella vulgata]|uniref:uncharacterized protein LOC126810248 n=1 Tax=Patella vulgata TaxID=6465 RepID=UPI0024A9E3DE|nr:uncharacterized protein LOC126810248 [Patella vulgata]